jgi:hypothetical protein
LAQKTLDAYKLGVILDASGAAKGVSALKDADKAATKTYSSLTQLSKSFKFALADKFKSELKEVENLSRSSGVGKVLGGIIGDGLKNGISSVFTAANLGKLIGTAIAPGVGTVVGTVVGSGVDAALEKISGPLMNQIQRGVELNKQLELTQLHYTAFTGSEKDAIAHLDALKKLSVSAGLDLPMLLTADQRLEEFNDDVKLSELELRAAADAAAKFGSGAEGFNSVANALGLIAERGELSSKTLVKLYKQGINVPQYLSEALGLSEKKVKELIAKNQLRGDVAARLIAEGIEVHSGGYAQRVANTTLAGQEARFAALQDSLAQRGTVNAAGALRDVYGLGNALLGSSQAGQVVDFLNNAAGGVISATKRAVSAGYDFTAGVVQGIASGDALNAIKNSVTSVADTAIGTFKSVLGIQSPSRVTAEQIGVPMAEGVVAGFEGYMADEGARRIAAAVAGAANSPELQRLINTIRARGFKITDVDTPGVHNRGSAHDKGRAVDFRTRDKSEADVRQMFDYLASLGYVVLDERRRPAGQAKWSGGHGHAQIGTEGISARGLSHIWGGAGVAQPVINDALGRLEGLIQENARRSGVPADLLRAMIFTESSGNPNAFNGVHQGLMEIGPDVRKMFGVTNAFDPAQNIRAGSSYMGGLLRQYNGDTRRALAAYNTGPGTVAREGLNAAGARYADKVLGNISVTNPLPVVVAGDLPGGYGALAGGPVRAQQSYGRVLQDTGQIVVDVTAKQDALDQSYQVSAATTRLFLGPMSLIPPVTSAAAQAVNTYSHSVEENRKAAIRAADTMTNIAGALGEISGLMPQQQVGKKRSFWSKLLGIGASFVSLIPGVGPVLGPILSKSLGIASSAVGGDWGGVVAGIASGLQTGGAFRPTSSRGATLGDVTAGGKVDGGRATGGPVRRGRAYVVGEYRSEVFEPNEDGYIHPSVDAYLRGGRGGPYRGDSGAVARLAEAVAMLHDKLSSVSPEHVLTVGAGRAPHVVTNAFMAHASRDPRVVEWMGRRVAGI